jgi:hypothetical protein
MSKLIIETAINGYIVRDLNDGSMPEEIEVISSDNQVTSARDLLWVINERIGVIGSRHDEERIRITIEPGDKWIAPGSVL